MLVQDTLTGNLNNSIASWSSCFPLLPNTVYSLSSSLSFLFKKTIKSPPSANHCSLGLPEPLNRDQTPTSLSTPSFIPALPQQNIMPLALPEIH